MKIGKFSKKYNLTRDTVRYYMELGILNPRKLGSQYDFTRRDEELVEELLRLKKLKFSLEDIGRMLVHSRLSRGTSYEIEERLGLYSDKLAEIRDEIIELQRLELMLIEELEAQKKLLEENDEKIKSGIHLSNLELLRCNRCQGRLEINNGDVVKGELIEGVLLCSCGERYQVDSGIVVGRSSVNYRVEKDIMERYIKGTNIEFKKNIDEQLDWVIKAYRKGDIGGKKKYLELGSGMGFFIREYVKYLEQDDIYIAVDFNINWMRLLKEVLDSRGVKNVIYICCDFNEIPLAFRSIDVLIDFYGSIGYTFNGGGDMLEKTDRYIKKESVFLGEYMTTKEIKSDILSDEIKKKLTIEGFREEIKGLNYKLTENIGRGVWVESPYEAPLKKGDKIISYAVHGKR